MTSDLDDALLSVWGRGSADVWFVGSAPAPDAAPAALHWDGTTFAPLSVPASGTLWWVAGGNDGPVWACGAGGTVLRWANAGAVPEVVPTPTSEVLFGILPVGEEVWAVGGDPAAQSGVVLRYDGATFAVVDVEPALAEGQTWFKIWGESPADLWLVGLGGRALHWNGTEFTGFDVPLGRRLLTAHGAGADVVAVGGAQSAHIVTLGAEGLSNVTPQGTIPQLNGVFVEEGGDATTVGAQGTVWRRRAGAWSAVAEVPEVWQDYHAVYEAPDDQTFAVGGSILLEPFSAGVVLHFGPSMEDAP